MARHWWGGRIAEQDPAPLTAAAVTVAINNPPSHVLWGGAQWQLEAWAHYDTCPELHAAAAIYGEAFSRAKMIAVDVDPQTLEVGSEPTTNAVATGLIAQLFGGPTGKAQAQYQMGLHLTVAGECWVLATDQEPDADAQPWRILSVTEVTKAGNQIRIQNLDGTQRNLVDGELLFRMFQPHPKMAWQADSPTRALLPVFRELAGLSSHILASLKSRLATGGVWLLPKSAAMEKSIDQFGAEIPGGQAGWMKLVADAMLTPIANPEDPSAIVPIVALVPDEILASIKDPIKFFGDIMAETQPLREAAVKRIAIGMDMPPERLLGSGEVNHWGQWFLDESFVKGQLTSKLTLPADAFTTKYLRPGINLTGGNPGLFAVAFDTDDMITEANEANAQQAWDSGELSSMAYLKALNFDPVRDAATMEERERKLLLQMVQRGNPQTVQELEGMIKLLFPNFKINPLQVLPPSGTLPQVGDVTGPAAPKAIAAPSTTTTQSPPPRPTVAPDNTPAAP